MIKKTEETDWGAVGGKMLILVLDILIWSLTDNINLY